MSKYQFIKSSEQMVNELNLLWNNTELYSFLKGPDYIKQRENEICCCLTNRKKELFILLAKTDWLMEQP
jgi:hypothetical protein